MDPMDLWKNLIKNIQPMYLEILKKDIAIRINLRLFYGIYINLPTVSCLSYRINNKFNLYLTNIKVFMIVILRIFLHKNLDLSI